MQSKPDNWWTYLTSMFDIATRYILYVRCERTGCVVPDFHVQAPIYLYTKTAIMRRSITELCRLTSFFITRWKRSVCVGTRVKMLNRMCSVYCCFHAGWEKPVVYSQHKHYSFEQGSIGRFSHAVWMAEKQKPYKLALLRWRHLWEEIFSQNMWFLFPYLWTYEL